MAQREWAALAALIIIVTILVYYPRRGGTDAIRVGISPYQDLAMLVNAESLGLFEY